MSNIKETLREIGIGQNGALFYHHFKKDDSNMWMYWVKHNGFGRGGGGCLARGNLHR